MVVAWVTLVRSPGRARIVGLVLLGWPVPSLLALAVPSVAPLVRDVGLGFLIVGLACVGILAFGVGVAGETAQGGSDVAQ